MSAPDSKDPTAPGHSPKPDASSIAVLDKIRRRGRVWGDLAAQYGVTNPDPPWKITLEATCDALAAGSCALPALERRWEEDELSAEIYADVPFPERQLLALAHSMIQRGLVNEDELVCRLEQVHRRLTSV
jgi:hypothetical protein